MFVKKIEEEKKTIIKDDGEEKKYEFQERRKRRKKKVLEGKRDLYYKFVRVVYYRLIGKLIT